MGHYGIVRDANKNSDTELGGGVSPDALLDALYGTNNIDYLVHIVIEETPSKYNPLSYDLYNVANGIGTSKEWADLEWELSSFFIGMNKILHRACWNDYALRKTKIKPINY